MRAAIYISYLNLSMTNPPLRIAKTVIAGESNARMISARLIDASQWFSVLPLPHDKWEIEVKEENSAMLSLWTKQFQS